MAKKLDPMDLKQIIRLHLEGLSNREISKTIGIGRNAVNHYMQLFRSCDMTFKALLKLDDSNFKELVSLFYKSKGSAGFRSTSLSFYYLTSLLAYSFKLR